jgi:hypothetical protein
MEEWRKIHNEELNDLFSLLNIVRVIKSRRMRWAEHVTWTDDESVMYRVLVGKPEGKRPLDRRSNRWEDNMRMDLLELDVGVWIGLGWLRKDTGGGHL